jgi:putative effector of murein hydrolase LrgA (UPF0299 family)
VLLTLPLPASVLAQFMLLLLLLLLADGYGLNQLHTCDDYDQWDGSAA